MTRYINTLNGAIVEAPSECSAPHYKVYSEEVEMEINKPKEDVPEKTPEVEEDPEKNPEVEEDPEKSFPTEITIKDIKQELDAMGIEYKSDMKKDDLYKLMMEGQ